MANNVAQQRTTVIIQVIILVLVCGGLVALAAAFGVFRPPKDYRNIVIRVENSSGSVQLIYSVPGDEGKSPVQVSTPWEKNISLKTGSEVIVSVISNQQMGELKCTIMLDGKTWKKESVKYPEDKVFCAGIIP